MILKYTTGKLPPNFFMLGVILFLLGILALVMSEIGGLIFLVLCIPLLFTRTGLLIDSDKKRIKKHTGLFSYKSGKWQSITNSKHLQIIRVQQTTGMAVLSISRNETNVVYKLLVVLANENIELLIGESEFINNAANHLSKALNLALKKPTN